MKYSLLALLLLISVSGRAEDVRMKDVFRQMPDALVPTLSANNRLDMIDFIDSNMKAEVTNLFGGKSEMTMLSDDSLTIRLSDALTIHMLLLKTEETTDDSHQVICMLMVYGTDSLSLDTKLDFYSTDWNKLDVRPRFSEIDEQRISTLETSTILNFMDAILKKD